MKFALLATTILFIFAFFWSKYNMMAFAGTLSLVIMLADIVDYLDEILTELKKLNEKK